MRNVECGMRNKECGIQNEEFGIKTKFHIIPPSTLRIPYSYCNWVHRHPQLDSSRQFSKITEAGLVESYRLRSVRTSGYGYWSNLNMSRRPLN
jgi:hypothetical protein